MPTTLPTLAADPMTDPLNGYSVHLNVNGTYVGCRANSIDETHETFPAGTDLSGGCSVIGVGTVTRSVTVEIPRNRTGQPLPTMRVPIGNSFWTDSREVMTGTFIFHRRSAKGGAGGELSWNYTGQFNGTVISDTVSGYTP